MCRQVFLALYVLFIFNNFSLNAVLTQSFYRYGFLHKFRNKRKKDEVNTLNYSLALNCSMGVEAGQ